MGNSKQGRRVCSGFLLGGLVLICGCTKSEDPVIASIGPVPITRAEFEKKLGDVAQEYQTYIITPTGRRQFFDILLREKLVLAAAQDSPVVRSQEYRSEVARFDAEQKERFKEYREYLLAKMWIESLRRDGTLRVSEEEIRDYHGKFPKAVMLRHVLVSNPEEARSVLDQLRKGASFKALAKSKSLDAETAPEGGVIPPFLYGELLPELSDVAFQMKVGELAGPVRSQFGYHIVRKDGDRTLPLEEASERIQRLLEKKKLDRYLETLRSRYPVRVNDAQFQTPQEP